jgi:hypothetical protein
MLDARSKFFAASRLRVRQLRDRQKVVSYRRHLGGLVRRDQIHWFMFIGARWTRAVRQNGFAPCFVAPDLPSQKTS